MLHVKKLLTLNIYERRWDAQKRLYLQTFMSACRIALTCWIRKSCLSNLSLFTYLSLSTYQIGECLGFGKICISSRVCQWFCVNDFYELRELLNNSVSWSPSVPWAVHHIPARLSSRPSLHSSVLVWVPAGRCISVSVTRGGAWGLLRHSNTHVSLMGITQKM